MFSFPADSEKPQVKVAFLKIVIDMKFFLILLLRIGIEALALRLKKLCHF